jgi:hypothetical protein
MARKLTVKLNGKTIGTRKTDRTYTHAIVRTDYRPEVSRSIAAGSWRTLGADNARKGHKDAIEAQSPTYRYASGITDAERARYAVIAAMPVEAYIAKCHADSLHRLEAEISRRLSVGAEVLSYCGRYDLAIKAQAAATRDHPAWTVIILPVEEDQAASADTMSAVSFA